MGPTKKSVVSTRYLMGKMARFLVKGCEKLQFRLLMYRAHYSHSTYRGVFILRIAWFNFF